jgi:hypothetical protein
VDVVAEQFLITEVLRWDTAVVRLPDVAECDCSCAAAGSARPLRPPRLLGFEAQSVLPNGVASSGLVTSAEVVFDPVSA